MTVPLARGYGQTITYDAGQRHAPLSTGAVVAIVCVAVVVLLLLAALGWYCGRGNLPQRLVFMSGTVPERSGAGSDGAGWSSGAVSGSDAPRRSSRAFTGSGAPGTSSGAVSGSDAPGRSSRAFTGSDAPGPSSGAVSGSDTGCRMCRAGYGVHSGEGLVVLECGHPFHRGCIRLWLQHNLTCPTCNATTIALIGVSSREAMGTPFHPSRYSMDYQASSDDLVEIRRSNSSRF